MGKTTVSHRLDDGLLEWANAYAKTRGTTRSILLEEGLRALQGLAKGGVPGLPVVDTPAVRQQRQEWSPAQIDEGRAEYARNIAARQRKLNEAKERASR